MIIKNLGGHSGCKIYLMEEGGNYFVRKYSGSLDYNERLKKQCCKQADFKSKSVKVPIVLNQGYEDGFFYFDMEYVKGVTLAKYLKKVYVGDINDLVDCVVNNIDFNKTSVNGREIFKNKITNLRSITSVLNKKYLNKALDVLEAFDWSTVCQSGCHGDLTLENIIVKNGELYFIDFLDSFFESFVLDIGKLFQDLEVMWSYRNDESLDINTNLRLLIFKNLLLKKVNKIDANVGKQAYYALLLHLCRIYPYTKDDKTMLFLENGVKKVLNNLERMYEDVDCTVLR